MPLSEFPLPADESSGQDQPEMRTPPPGPMSKAATERLSAVECPAYGHLREQRAQRSGVDTAPIVLATGRGSNLWDVDGNRYVDLAAGFGSLLLGHASTSVDRATSAQADRLVQGLGDVYSADAKIALLERLASLHPGVSPRVILGSSGSDAVTAGIKTAMLATGKAGIVAFEGAYHGLGYAPLPACGLRESLREPFAAQLNAHVTFAPYPRNAGDVGPSLGAVEAALARGDVGAVLVEPILGRGGVVVPPDSFLHGVCSVAKKHGALVIADEVWTGLGRSGAMLRTTEVGAPADIVCLGKGLGGGFPMSACIAPEPIMRAWAREREVVHTSTHAGHPLACAAAVATFDAIRFKKLVARAQDVGPRALETLREALDGAPGLVEVRGEGLMIGIELASGELALRAMRGMLSKGYVVLTGGVRGETLTWTPALTIGEELLASAATVTREVLHALAAP